MTTRFPICAATVTINGSRYPQKSMIWAGLRLWEAEIGPGAQDHHLRVPWCHIDDPYVPDQCHYRVRPIDERSRFVHATNGALILEAP